MSGSSAPANALAGKDILHINDLSLPEIELIMRTAGNCETYWEAGELPLGFLRGRTLATLFGEPSTRTRFSFEVAMQTLGGTVISAPEAGVTSLAKGESFYDMGRVIGGGQDHNAFVSVIVMRHPQIGSVAELAEGSLAPVINGGDGTGEHPTQALLDLFTIRKELGRVGGLTIGLMGDLKHGRTVHSLARLMARFPSNRFVFISPLELAMPLEITSELLELCVPVNEVPELVGPPDAEASRGPYSVLNELDVLYVTRIQRERFQDPSEYERLAGSYVVNRALLERRRCGTLTIMHPLPRVGEIARDVDDYPGAAYFRQAANGLYVRMALLALVCGDMSG